MLLSLTFSLFVLVIMEARKRIDKKQKGLTQGDDGGKYLQWNLEMDRSLADILRSEIKSGRKSDGGWKTTAFTSAALKMSAKYNIIVLKDNVKNHLKGWKKTYTAVADI
ncbi:hypothetical protein M0R45_015803 [Rubus argutus]|uniref:Myb/SANT-like domain-containing protein n=1 Tax=Rubus argutus TaxID=59490 RepID=A0AAW1XRN5_RUBAR